ncbi:DUF3383 family protein [Clostridiales bacterium FE2010]|nr:DUF3383 family protein [Clostridiales bacterium FE2010]
MLSIDNVARVVVNTIRASASPSSFDTGLLLVQDSNYADARRLQTYLSATETAAGLIALGFGTTSEPYKAAIKYFAASPSPGRLLVSCYPVGEDLRTALDSVLDRTAAFYGVMVIGTMTAGNWLAFAQHIESLPVPLMLFVPVMGTVVSAIADDGILDKLHGAQLKRAMPFYCADTTDCAAVMGTAMGLELSHKESAFALCYKTIYGIIPSGLTQSEVNDLKALNCNVYVARGFTHFLLENGTAANGRRYDEVLYVDKIADDLQNAAVTLLAENPDKLPQTDDSTAQFINRFSSILMGYTDRGILASAMWRGVDIGPVRNGDIVENGFMLWADSYDDQSDADRVAHRAVPVQVALCLAGSIESIVITVNVQI